MADILVQNLVLSITLNVDKTKEMYADSQRTHCDHFLLSIDASAVEIIQRRT